MKLERQPKFDTLLSLLIADGVREVEVEYDDSEWWVQVIEGNTGIGVARYSSEPEKRYVDRVLERLEKERSISVNGQLYALRFKCREQFGEPCWRIRITRKP